VLDALVRSRALGAAPVARLVVGYRAHRRGGGAPGL